MKNKSHKMNVRLKHLLFYFILFPLMAQDEYSITGKITDSQSNEPLVGANIIETITENGTASASDGSYSLLLPKGKYTIKVSYIGYNSIKKEINLVEQSKFDKIDNPLKNAPHTYVELASNEWKHSYTREEAAFPTEYVKNNKYWAPVGRVDNVFGDRNLVCSCPSMDEYKDEAA